MQKKINPPDLCQVSTIKIHKQTFCFLEACPFSLTKQAQPWSRWLQPTTFVLIFNLNECQLQQADKQNKIKPHVKVLFSNLQLWSHITNKAVPYQYNCVEPNSMLKWGKCQESLDGMHISEDFL